MEILKNKKQYLIDWVNSLDIFGSIFVNQISDLKDGTVLLNILKLLNSYDFNFENKTLYEKENNLSLISSIMKQRYNYNFYPNINDKNSTEYEILSLLDYLKIRFDEKEKNSHLMKNEFQSQNKFLQINENNLNQNILPLNQNYSMKNKSNIDYNSQFLKPQSSKNINIINKKETQDDILNDNNNKNILKNINSFDEIVNDKENQNFIYNNKKIMTIGIPSIIRDDFNFLIYKFLKPSNPILLTEFSLNQILKIPFSLSNHYFYLSNQENNSRDKDEIELLVLNEKEKFILNILYDLKLITEKEKNKKILWKKIIPKCEDGTYISKIINLLEGKKEDVLKGISNNTFNQTNININWRKISQFMIEKENFKSYYLFKENFYLDHQKLFDFLYDICHYYKKFRKTMLDCFQKTREKMKRKNEEEFIKGFKDNNPKGLENIKEIENISKSFKGPYFNNGQQHYLIDKNSLIQANTIINESINKGIINFRTVKENQTTNPIINLFKKDHNSRTNLKSKIKKSNLSFTNETSNSLSKISKEELLKIRKNIKYEHKSNPTSKQNKENTPKKKIKQMKVNPIISKNDVLAPIQGQDQNYDDNVKEITLWLSNIGFNTKNINFYKPEITAFKDGTLFYKIISKLENNPKIIPRIDLEPRTPSTSVNNIKLLIKMLMENKKKFPVFFLNKEREIYKGYPNIIVQFLKTLKLVYQNHLIDNKNLEQKSLSQNFLLKNINPKNIELSAENTYPLNKTLRQDFLVKEKKKVWA